jgi:hypothetical protein
MGSEHVDWIKLQVPMVIFCKQNNEPSLSSIKYWELIMWQSHSCLLKKGSFPQGHQAQCDWHCVLCNKKTQQHVTGIWYWTHLFHLQGQVVQEGFFFDCLTLEALRFYDTSGTTCQNTQRHIREDLKHFQQWHCENLKSCSFHLSFTVLMCGAWESFKRNIKMHFII